MIKYRQLFLWSCNMLILAGVGLVGYWLARDVERTTAGYQELFQTARAIADLENWRDELTESATVRQAVRVAFLDQNSLTKFIEELEVLAVETKTNLILSELSPAT